MNYKHQNRKHPNQASDQPQRQPLQDGPISVVCVPPPPTDQEAAEKKKRDRRVGIKFWVSNITLVVLSIYTCLTGVIAVYSIRSANAAKKSADTTANQLELEERPWISSTPTIASPLFMDENGANLVLEFEMKNTGHSPSIGAFTYPKFFVPAHNPEESEFQKRTACDGAVRAAKGEDDVIYPGDHTTKKAKFRWSRDEIVSHSKGGFFVADIVTCTAYRTSFNDKIYSSAQIYNFYRVGPNGSMAFEGRQGCPDRKS